MPDNDFQTPRHKGQDDLEDVEDELVRRKPIRVELHVFEHRDGRCGLFVFGCSCLSRRVAESMQAFRYALQMRSSIVVWDVDTKVGRAGADAELVASRRRVATGGESQVTSRRLNSRRQRDELGVRRRGAVGDGLR